MGGEVLQTGGNANYEDYTTCSTASFPADIYVRASVAPVVISVRLFIQPVPAGPTSDQPATGV